MISIDINTANLAQEFGLTRQNVEGLMEYTVGNITAMFAHAWEDETKKLKRSRRRYKSAIQVDKRGRFTGAVYLNPAAWLPNALEMGHPAYDMKPGLLGSKSVRISKEGKRYMYVPFRFATPGAIGDNELFSGQMPEEVHAAAKQNDGLPLGLDQIPSEHHIPESAALRSQLKSMSMEEAEKVNKGSMTSIYEGVRKTNDGYVNFRAVSENSDPQRFLHPGFEEANLAGSALGKFSPTIPDVVDRSIDNFLSDLGF